MNGTITIKSIIAFNIQLEEIKKINYIDKQHEHHKTHSFKDEFLDILQKYDIDYDKKYIWNW